MHSPLPDSRALEEGIIADRPPSTCRLSLVQDNVRHLLRASAFGSIAGSSSYRPRHDSVVSSSGPFDQAHPNEAMLPSPVLSTHSTRRHAESFQCPPPPPRVSSLVAMQRMAHQSTLFTTQAVAALDHPDLGSPLSQSLAREKALRKQRRAGKQSRHPRRGLSTQSTRTQSVICVLAALLLASLAASCKQTLQLNVREDKH